MASQFENDEICEPGNQSGIKIKTSAAYNSHSLELT